MYRRCPNCYRTEGIRANFGDNREAEAAFHQRKWCDCGYSSPEEMMRDQDLGFDDPKWVPIAKEFLNRYHGELRSGLLSTKGDYIRCFLLSLKSSFDNHLISSPLLCLKMTIRGHSSHQNQGPRNTSPKQTSSIHSMNTVR